MPNPKRLSGRFRFVNTEADDTLQYSTPSFKRLSASQRRTLNEVRHVWKTGDRYYKLAATYYGRPELWWAIALYNEKPTVCSSYISHYEIKVPQIYRLAR